MPGHKERSARKCRRAVGEKRKGGVGCEGVDVAEVKEPVLRDLSGNGEAAVGCETQGCAAGAQIDDEGRDVTAIRIPRRIAGAPVGEAHEGGAVEGGEGGIDPVPGIGNAARLVPGKADAVGEMGMGLARFEAKGAIEHGLPIGIGGNGEIGGGMVDLKEMGIVGADDLVGPRERGGIEKVVLTLTHKPHTGHPGGCGVGGDFARQNRPRNRLGGNFKGFGFLGDQKVGLAVRFEDDGAVGAQIAGHDEPVFGGEAVVKDAVGGAVEGAYTEAFWKEQLNIAANTIGRETEVGAGVLEACVGRADLLARRDDHGNPPAHEERVSTIEEADLERHGFHDRCRAVAGVGFEEAFGYVHGEAAVGPAPAQSTSGNGAAANRGRGEALHDKDRCGHGGNEIAVEMEEGNGRALEVLCVKRVSRRIGHGDVFEIGENPELLRHCRQLGIGSEGDLQGVEGDRRLVEGGHG